MPQEERLLSCDSSWQETSPPWHWTQSEQGFWRRKEGAVSRWTGSCTTWHVDCSMGEVSFSQMKPKRQIYTQVMGSSLSCRSWKERPHSACCRVQGRQIMRVSKEVFGQTDSAWQQAGWKCCSALRCQEMSGDIEGMEGCVNCNTSVRDFLSSGCDIFFLWGNLEQLDHFSCSLCITALPLTAYPAGSSGEEACQEFLLFLKRGHAFRKRCLGCCWTDCMQNAFLRCVG